MSIFNKSFDPGVRKQLELREQILSGQWDSDSSGDILYGRSSPYLQYANNKTPFIRLSSGVDVIDPILQKYFNLNNQNDLAERFVLEGGTRNTDNSQKGMFEDVYKKDWSDANKEDDLGLRPMAGISGMSVKSFGDKIATLRIATVNIECYTLQQLEALELLYMRPGYRVLLEWGHTMYFDKIESTPNKTSEHIDIIKSTGKKTKKEIFDAIKTNKKNSSYNYDAMFGKVRNFSWEAQADGSYKCLAEIISLGDIIDSLKISVELLEPKKKSKLPKGTKSDPITTNNSLLQVLTQIKNLQLTNNYGTHGGYLFISYRDIYSIFTPIIRPPKSRKSVFNTYYNPVSTKDSNNPINLHYIPLQVLLNIINDVCIFKEGKSPITKILTNTTPYYEAKCRSHPYQLSGDPYKFLISPYFIGSSVSSKYSEVNYGGVGYDNNRLNNFLTTHFPFRTTKSGKFEELEGNIFNILVEVNYIESVFKSLITEEQNKYNVYLKDFIQTILDDFVSSTGFVNDLSLVVDPVEDDQYMIIDNNLMEAKFSDAHNYYTVPLMGVGNLEGIGKGGTYVRSYRLNTQLTNNIATIVSINAQSDSQPIDGYEASVFNAFNQGIKDRLQEPFSSSVNGTYTSSSISTSNLYTNTVIDLRKIHDVSTQNYKSSANSFITPQETAPLCNNIQRLINYNNSFTKENRFTFGSYTPVPLKFNCVMDGITGIRVGQIFLLPKDRLPHQYKAFDTTLYGKNNLGKQKIGFIVFGINHNVSKGTGWVTELDCQMVMLNIDKYGLDIDPIPFVPLDVDEGYALLRVYKIPIQSPNIVQVAANAILTGIKLVKVKKNSKGDSVPDNDDTISFDPIELVIGSGQPSTYAYGAITPHVPYKDSLKLKETAQNTYNTSPWDGYKLMSVDNYLILAKYENGSMLINVAPSGTNLTSLTSPIFKSYGNGPIRTRGGVLLDNALEYWLTNGIPLNNIKIGGETGEETILQPLNEDDVPMGPNNVGFSGLNDLLNL